jgi:hypothetical protein
VHERVTTGLDVLGLLLIAAGVCALLFPAIGWGGLVCGGAVVLAGSWWAATSAAARASSKTRGDEGL